MILSSLKKIPSNFKKILSGFNNFINFKKLSNSFIVPTTILVFITLSTFTIITSLMEQSKQKQALEQTINNTLKLAEYSAMDPLWNYNMSGIEYLGDALMEIPEIGAVSINNENGVEIYTKKAVLILFPIYLTKLKEAVLP